MDNINYSKEICIFGKTLPVKNYICSKNGCPYTEKNEDPPKIQLSITPTSFCAASCPFCVAASTISNQRFLDIKKLENVLVELNHMNVVRGINITGGEPFTDIDLLDEIVNLVFDIFGPEIQLSINTNGIGLNKLDKIRRYLFIDTIHISRHHYDDARNRDYFHLNVPTEEELTEIVGKVKDKRLFVFNCLLLADGIGSKEEVKRFLDFSDRVGVPKVGFVTPMDINPYTKKNQVSYKAVFDTDDPDFLFTNKYKDLKFCECQDGIYVTKEGRLVEFYGRETGYGTGEFARGLVYTADNQLKSGYGENAILIADM
jgi:Predicted Fe-S oxidoreductases